MTVGLMSRRRTSSMSFGMVTVSYSDLVDELGVGAGRDVGRVEGDRELGDVDLAVDHERRGGLRGAGVEGDLGEEEAAEGLGAVGRCGGAAGGGGGHGDAGAGATGEGGGGGD